MQVLERKQGYRMVELRDGLELMEVLIDNIDVMRPLDDHVDVSGHKGKIVFEFCTYDLHDSLENTGRLKQVSEVWRK